MGLLISMLAGCAGDEPSNEWEVFQKLLKQDGSGEIIDCSNLVSTRVAVEEKLFHPRYEVVDILDFIFEKNATFKQCGDEIKSKVNQYCRMEIRSAIRGLTNKSYGDEPSRKFRHYCNDEFKAALSNVNYNYQLPTSKSDYFIFDDYEIMVRPSSIQSISYKVVEKDLLWSVSLHTKDYTFDLYFGDINAFEKAKRELSVTSY